MIICDGKIAKNFTLNELANNMAKEKVKLQITPEFISFINRVQRARDVMVAMYPSHYTRLGFIVNSCYRTKAFNASVGGDKNSAHLEGRAIDISSIPKEHYNTLTNVWQTICEQDNMIGGINYYTWGVHLTDNEDRFGRHDFTIRDLR